MDTAGDYACSSSSCCCLEQRGGAAGDELYVWDGWHAVQRFQLCFLNDSSGTPKSGKYKNRRLV